MKRKRRPIATTPPATTVGVVRIGFSPSAKVAFDRLPPKVRVGLRRKLYDFGKNPAIGKPLIGELQGYHRVTYGRVRAISKALPEVVATIEFADGRIVVFVLEVGPRKDGALDDPYERAAIAALRSGDRDAQTLLEQLIHQLHAGLLPEVEDDES